MKLSEKLAAIEKEAPAPSEGTKTAGRKPGTALKAAATKTSAATAKGKPSADAGASAKRAAARTGRDASWEATKRQVRDLVLEELAPRMASLSPEQVESELLEELGRILDREDVEVTTVERRKFVQEMLADTLGYGPLDALLHDDTITEVMCNAHNDIWVERDGKIERTNVRFTDDAQYRQVIEKIVSAVGRRVDEGSPMVDARLPDGSRVNAIIPPLAIHGSVLTIRKFAADPYTAKDLINFGTYTLGLVQVLEACVRGKLNILVSGGTGTGKTTNLNVLSSFIPESERILTIEDSAELQLQQEHVINLESRPPNVEGKGQVAIRDLVRNALRMRPDRIIVGEVRGAEALDMLQAMNTGHEGSMTTVHANSTRDAMSRLETMVLMAGFDLPMRAIREQIASAVDIIMQVDRMPDGRRVVTAVTEVQGLEGDVILLQDLFSLHYDRNRRGDAPNAELVPTGLRPKFLEQLKEQGIELPLSALRPPVPAPPSMPSRRGKPPSPRELVEQERLR